jgi:hypothetical protein
MKDIRRMDKVEPIIVGLIPVIAVLIVLWITKE